MKRIIIQFLLGLLPVLTFAHGGEDHGDAKKTAISPARFLHCLPQHQWHN